MKTLIEQSLFYSHYHYKKITLYTHLVGVPLLMLSFMIVLGFFKLIVPGVFATTLASIGTLLLFLYYLRLHWQLALLFLPILVLLLWLSSLISENGPTAFALWAFLIIFILGAVLQIVGLMMEGNKPALLDSFMQSLIAPLFLTAELCFMLGQMPTLEEQLHSTPLATSEELNARENKEPQ